MKKQEYLNKLNEYIDALKRRYQETDEKDYIERGILLGKINAFYDALILAYDIEVINL